MDARSEAPAGWRGAIGEGVDPHRLIGVVRRRLWLAGAVFLLAVVATMAAIGMQPTLYTAAASLTIDTRRARVVDAEAVLSGLTAEAAVVDTEVEILRSRQLAERVVDALGLIHDPEFAASASPPWLGDADRRATLVDPQARREQVIDAVLERLRIARMGGTYVMQVAFESRDPAKAARIANAFADQYLLQQLQTKGDATRHANSWLTERLTALRVELEAAEGAVERYRAENGLLSAEGATLTEQEISAYNQQRATARSQQAEEAARLRTARAQLARGSSGEDVGGAAVAGGPAAARPPGRSLRPRGRAVQPLRRAPSGHGAGATRTVGRRRTDRGGDSPHRLQPGGPGAGRAGSGGGGGRQPG